MADLGVADRGVADLAGFIRTQARLAAPPLIPDVQLWLSQDEPTALWERLEEVSGRTDLPPPFWAFPWTGGIALARYLLDHPGQVAGQAVLDLASGSGLVAIVAARLGAQVTASDIDPVAVTAIGLNAAANGVTVTITDTDLLATVSDAAPDSASHPGRDLAGHPTPNPASHSSLSELTSHSSPASHPNLSDLTSYSSPASHSNLASHSDLTSLSNPISHISLVLVGDAFYERRMAHRAMAFLRRMRSDGARVLIGDPGRAYLPPDLCELARYPVPAWAGLEDTEIKPTTVWELP